MKTARFLSRRSTSRYKTADRAVKKAIAQRILQEEKESLMLWYRVNKSVIINLDLVASVNKLGEKILICYSSGNQEYLFGNEAKSLWGFINQKCQS